MSQKKQPPLQERAPAKQPAPRQEPAPHVPSPQPARRGDALRRAALAPGSLTRRDVLQLQRAAGNRAVGKLLGHGARPQTPKTPRPSPSAPLPGRLKAGVERLSGLSFDGVRVHYDSPRPAALQALAYTQGDDIHLGPGQEQHLAHEAWHVAQQKQGRVPASKQFAGVTLNEDAALEAEADAMGARALGGPGLALPREEAVVPGPKAGGARVPPVQRKKMPEVMAEQHKREAEVKKPEYRKEKGTGKYTTVGFEWDIAVTAEHSSEAPNLLQGLSHVELAESDFALNGLHYILETDAGNVLELVTPPFFLRTRGGPQLLPTTEELSEIMGATREALLGIVESGQTLETLMGEKGWASQFEINDWEMKALEPSWRNWSTRAQPGAAITSGLNEASVKDITISEVTLGKERLPQINIATDVATFERVQDPEEARVDDSAIKGIVEESMRTMRPRIVKMFRDVDEGAPKRLGSFIEQLLRVLAQQHVVPYIGILADQARLGWSGQPTNKNIMDRAGGAASYAKDITNVWLKTDLLSFGAATVKREDWAVVADALETLHAALPNSRKMPIGDTNAGATKVTDEQVRGHMTAFAKQLSDQANRLKATATKQKDYEEALQEIFDEVAGELPDYGEHNPKVLGVRQDTFISPATMRKLSAKLNLQKMLFVMEVRNTKPFLDWLKKDEKKLPGTKPEVGSTSGSTSSEESPPEVDEGVLALAEEVRLHPPDGLVDAGGDILPNAMPTFVTAYKDDVKNTTAYLTEAEGHIIAKRLRIAVRVYRGAVPEGYVAVPNDGGGNCLIHSLWQAFRASRGQDPTLAPSGAIRDLRSHVADRLDDVTVGALCAAAVTARVYGGAEPGLGRSMRALLDMPTVSNAKRRAKEQPSKEEKKKGSEESSSSKKGAQGPVVVEMPQFGEGQPLANYAIRHTGGAHYEMLRRTG